ncbi:MAG: insulinase family protein, partial [Oscillospiraceae bacterium]|nr:insulinase family protein [Oscillospiraceae bacterium]
MQINDRIHGFCVLGSEPLPELGATLWRMEYEKNGAQLVWLEREDDNKTFAITFKTIPQDDTGVFHILEHSVLNGSEKYPVREPFVELLKSSLSTFLNAFTFPDKTMYPVSSRNDADFLHLMDVYLDAVLHPLCIRDDHAFLQEGWHYEPTEDGGVTVNGVVFNEMKGDYSNPESRLRLTLLRALFPDSPYGFSSGGDPAHIPELTYEQYCASHARFYHPSNSRILLDGAVDLDAALAKLDGYLRDFERIDPDADIPMQPPVRSEATDYYEIGPEERAENKALLARGWVYGAFDEPEKTLALNALAAALTGTNDAPLKKALLDAGLCEDISFGTDDGMQQNYAYLLLYNADERRADEAWRIAEDTLRAMADGGLDRERVRNVLRRIEFSTREKDFGRMPRGVVYAIQSMDAWLYGGDPAQGLRYDAVFDSLREKLDAGWFEDFLRAAFLDNPHAATVALLPSKTLGAETAEAERQRLAAVRAGWTPEQDA